MLLLFGIGATGCAEYGATNAYLGLLLLQGGAAPESGGEEASLPDIRVTLAGSERQTGDHYDYGSLVVGQTSSITLRIENAGDATLQLSGAPALVLGGANPAEFAVSQPGVSELAPGAGVDLSLGFEPTSVGAGKAATVSIASNDPDEATFTLNLSGAATATPEPEINVRAVSPSGTSLADGAGSYDFGSVTADGDGGTTSASISFFIENIGTANLSLAGASLADATHFDLDTSGLAASVAPGASTSFIIRYDPTAVAGHSTTLTINNDDADENPYTFTIVGTGTAVPVPEINVRQGGSNLADGAGSYDFGSVIADGDGGTASSVITFTIENLGTAALSVAGVAVSNTTDFDLDTSGLSASVAAGGSTTFTIRYDPLTVAADSATVTINNNDADENPYTFVITGTGTAVPAPEIAVSQGGSGLADGSGSYGFGNFRADGDGGLASAYVTFTITNSGTAALTLSTPTLDDATHFDLDTASFSTSVAAGGGTTTFGIRFDPQTAGARSATVTIANNDADENPYTFAITGTGLDGWWNTSYGFRRRIVFGTTHDALPTGYTIALPFDTRTAATNVALASGNDVRIVWQPHSGASVELDRLADVWNNASSTIEFRLQSDIAALANVDADGDYYVYYGNAGAGTPPTDEWDVYFFADFFNRADSNTVGGPWTSEWNNSGADARINGNALGIEGDNGTVDTGVYADFPVGAIPGDFTLSFDWTLASHTETACWFYLINVGSSAMGGDGSSLTTGVGPGLYYGGGSTSGQSYGQRAMDNDFTSGNGEIETVPFGSYSFELSVNAGSEKFRYSRNGSSVGGFNRDYVNTGLALTRLRIASECAVQAFYVFDNLKLQLNVGIGPAVGTDAEETP